MSRASDSLFVPINLSEIDILSSDSIPSKTAQRSKSSATVTLPANDASSSDTWVGDEALWAVMTEGDVQDDHLWLSYVVSTAPATDNFEFWAWSEGAVMEGEGASSNLDMAQDGIYENCL